MSGKEKKSLKSLVYVLVIGLASGATGEIKADTHRHYFPLNVGNSWTYIDCNDASTKTFTIIGVEKINGHIYYKFDDYFRVCSLPGLDPNMCPPEDNNMLFRYDPNTDKVLQFWPSINEDVVRYDFSGDEFGEGAGNQLIEAGFTHNVPAGEFNDCCKFGFAMNLWCGYFREILAPGIGNIEGVGNDGGFELQSYTIYPVGDLNYDRRVDMLDFAIFASNWLECTAPECD